MRTVPGSSKHLGFKFNIYQNHGSTYIPTTDSFDEVTLLYHEEIYGQRL